MVAVASAFLIGILLGLLARPFLDAYFRWKTARLYAEQPVADDELVPEVVKQDYPRP